jgi:hypothetical protein
VIFRRVRFGELVDRQLDLFESDVAALLADAEAADEAWTHAPREESEERFGEYQLVVDAVAERLYDVREAYAVTLEDGAANEYRSAFDQAARKRFRRYTALLEE